MRHYWETAFRSTYAPARNRGAWTPFLGKLLSFKPDSGTIEELICSTQRVVSKNIRQKKIPRKKQADKHWFRMSAMYLGAFFFFFLIKIFFWQSFLVPQPPPPLFDVLVTDSYIIRRRGSSRGAAPWMKALKSILF